MTTITTFDPKELEAEVKEMYRSVTEVQLPETIVCNTTLWAACIGGAAQQDNYRQMIAGAGLRLVTVQDNPRYQFISDNAKGASKKFGVKSVSLLAVKP
jgi:arsenite methyltransferase